MARPQKEGLDYFPLEIGIDQDDKLIVPVAKYGMQGLGVIVMIMAEIYKNSYYYSWTIKEHYVFAKRVNVDINEVTAIINECAEWGFFDRNLLETHQILTSKGFQKRYIEAARRRKSITMTEDYLLIDPLVESKEITINVVNADGKTVNVYIKPSKCADTHTENTQSKVKESKVLKKTLPRQQKTYAENSESFRMAVYLHDRIMQYADEIGKGHLVQDANLQKWADDCRKILEIDKRDKSEAKAVIDWATGDPFWQQNILSPSKLRDKYTELAMKMTGKRTSVSSANERQFEHNRREAQKIMEVAARERIGTEANLLAYS